MPITKYLWDGDNILAETDGNDTVTTVYTNEPQQYGNLVSQRSGTTTSYFHFDALGSTRQLTTAAGVVSDTFTYNAWGEEVARTGSTATPFRWIGELGYYWDSERQLYYIRHRSYSGSIGLWISVDPLVHWIGAVQEHDDYSAYDVPSFVDPSLNTQNSSLTHFIIIHFYKYVMSSPVVYLDPSGNDIWYENTTSVKGLHQRVCVDTWNATCTKKTGKYCISFGVFNPNDPPAPPAPNPNNPTTLVDVALSDPNGDVWLPGSPIVHTKNDGVVYEDVVDPAKGKPKRLTRTKCCEDRNIQRFFRRLINRRADYILKIPGGYTCRDFSHDTLSFVSSNLDGDYFQKGCC